MSRASFCGMPRIAWQDLLRLLNPERHVLGRISHEPRNVSAGADPMQRWANIAIGARYPGNVMTTAATVLADQFGTVSGVTSEIDRAGSFAPTASGEHGAEQQDHQKT